MKLRNRIDLPARSKVDMTPMIDVVFQLLIFFMCTLKVIEPEGDFDISMPLGAPKADSVTDAELPPFKVRMQADAGWRTELRSASMEKILVAVREPFRRSIHESFAASRLCRPLAAISCRNRKSRSIRTII